MHNDEYFVTLDEVKGPVRGYGNDRSLKWFLSCKYIPQPLHRIHITLIEEKVRLNASNQRIELFWIKIQARSG